MPTLKQNKIKKLIELTIREKKQLETLALKNDMKLKKYIEKTLQIHIENTKKSG